MNHKLDSQNSVKSDSQLKSSWRPENFSRSRAVSFGLSAESVWLPRSARPAGSAVFFFSKLISRSRSVLPLTVEAFCPVDGGRSTLNSRCSRCTPPGQQQSWRSAQMRAVEVLPQLKAKVSSVEDELHSHFGRHRSTLPKVVKKVLYYNNMKNTK